MSYYSENDVIIGYRENELQSENRTIGHSGAVQEDTPDEVLYRIQSTCKKLEEMISNSYKDDDSELEDFEFFLNQ